MYSQAFDMMATVVGVLSLTAVSMRFTKTQHKYENTLNFVHNTGIYTKSQ